MNNPALPEKKTIVSIGLDRFKTIIKSEGHTLLADEPEAMGGTGQGLNPFSLLLSSLGSCGAITARMYADRKQWPLKNVDIALYVEEVEVNGNLTEQIVKDVKITGPLTSEQKQRIVEIMDRCPIQKIAQKGITIRTNLL